MNVLLIGLGASLVVVVLRDIFHTLGHPAGRGSLSPLVQGAIWRLSRHRGGHGGLARLAGPLGLLAVMGIWGVLAVIGWALVYWPFVPEGFHFSSDPPVGHGNAALDALYLSLVTISTLGFGDIVPDSAWMRIATPVEALFGFALLTVAVSWTLQISPALSRRRALAIRLAILRRSDASNTLHQLEAIVAAELLQSVANSLVAVRVDLTQFSETYYFRDDERNFSLAANLGCAIELGRTGATSPRADVRWAATVLNYALNDFVGLLDDEFLHLGGAVPELLDAYAADHGHSPI